MKGKDGKHHKMKHHASKMHKGAKGHKKMAKGGKMIGKVDGMKASGRLDKKARGGKVSNLTSETKMPGGERPNAEGMTPEKPMSNATKTEKLVTGEKDKK